MPYLLPHFSTINKKFVLILAFGNLSYLEACSVLSDRLSSSKQLWEDVAMLELKDARGGYEKLAGVHKVVVSITPNSPENVNGFDKVAEIVVVSPKGR